MKTNIYNVRGVMLLFFACIGLAFSSRATNYTFHQAMTGANEVPPNGSPGMGALVGMYDDVTNTLSYGIYFNNLSSGTVAGHIHGPATPAQNAGVIFPFTGLPLGVTTGVYANSNVLTNAQETELMAGLWYANIHTSAFPGGEIRAQIILDPLASTVYPFVAMYSGTQEVPPNASPASGAIIGTYDLVTNTMTYADGFKDLMAGTTASHFHAPAPPGVSAGVIIPKTGFPTSVTQGTFINSAVLTDAQESQLLAGLVYSNIHTTAFPGGEIRAQIFLKAPPTFINDNTIVLNTSCFGNDGNISIIPLTGVAPFMYSIDGGTTYVAGPSAGYTFTNLGVGTYNLRLKDSQGNESAIVTKTITQQYGNPPTFLNNNQIVLDASCGKNDGGISIIPTGGTAPFKYSIDGGATWVSGPNSGYTFANLTAGTYTLKLKGANGCESAPVQKIVKSVYGCPVLRSDGMQLTMSNSKASISVYPNPTRGRFALQLGNLGDVKAEVTILDGKGAVIQKRQIMTSEGAQFNFDLTRHAPGLYHIKVVSDKNVFTTKVLLQK